MYQSLSVFRSPPRSMLGSHPHSKISSIPCIKKADFSLPFSFISPLFLALACSFICNSLCEIVILTYKTSMVVHRCSLLIIGWVISRVYFVSQYLKAQISPFSILCFWQPLNSASPRHNEHRHWTLRIINCIHNPPMSFTLLDLIAQL